MRRSALWCALGAAGAVAAAGTLARAAEPTPGDKADAKPWYARLTPTLPAVPGLPGADMKPDAGKTFAATPARPLPIAPLEPAALAEALKAEQDAWDRRLEVCYKLRVIGGESNDDALLKKADDLEKQATALYHGRAARLGVKGQLRGKAEPTAAAPLPTPPAAAPAATPARAFKVVTP